jgi:hypothetical protein
MLLTNGKKTIELNDSMDKKIQNYINAGWTEVKPEVEPEADPVEEPTQTEENEDVGNSW